MRWGYKRMADLRVSTTDPDASPMHQKKRSASRLGYLTHYVVDGGKARVILDALVTGAEVTENLPMQEMLFRSTFRWGLRPRSVTGDAAYGTTQNIATVERAGIRAFVALPDHEKRSPLFSRDAFIYDAERDHYTCPQGEILRRQGHDHKEGTVRYVPSPPRAMSVPSKGMHQEREGALAKPQPPRGVSRKGARIPPHRAIPQGPKEAGGIGRAALRGGQRVARFEAVQAKAA